MHDENLPDSRSDWHMQAPRAHTTKDSAQLVREGARWHCDLGEQGGMLLAVLSVLAKAISSP